MQRKYWVAIMLWGLLPLLGWTNELPVIPSPKVVEWREGVFTLDSNTVIVLEKSVSRSHQGIQILQQVLQEQFNLSSQIFSSRQKSGKTPKIHLELEKFKRRIDKHLVCPEMLEEGYYLSITPFKIDILAETPRGLFYGLMTLVQMLKAAEQPLLPAVTIRDYPGLAWRGISDDFSRGQVSTMDNFKQIIRFLAEYKLNIYMPYIEDVFQFDRYPNIGAGRGALSKAELTELQEYARNYYVEIIPIFQTLGHYENILNLPAYTPFAEFPGAASLNTINPEADRFLFNLLDEVIPAFQSEYFHMGADESWDVGLGATKALTSEIGIAAVHANHYNKVYKYLKKASKKPLMYGDIILRHPEIMELIPKDIIIVDWHYGPSDNYPSLKQFRENGFQVLASPGIHNWRNPFPDFSSAWINISNINREAYRYGALGSINSNWGDYGGANFREYNYLGYAYGAEFSWNPQSNSAEEDLNHRFFQQFFGVSNARLNSLWLHLNEIPQLTDFKKIWRQPFYPTDENPGLILERADLLLLHSQAALALINDIRPLVKFHSNYLDYLEMAARLGCYAGDKLSLARQIALLQDNPELATIQRLESLVTACTMQINELTELEKQYEQLWYRNYRSDNLFRILQLFCQQRAYWSAARDCLSNGKTNIPTVALSKWITSVQFNPENPNIPPAYLRKSFKLDDISLLQFARLQLAANNDARVYLNGKEIGQVIATKSLSLWVENQRVAAWDVADQLQCGLNYLAVSVQGYKPNLPSLANIYLEMTWSDGQIVTILSDSTWQAREAISADWQEGRQNQDGSWHPAIEFYDYPWPLTAPLFYQEYNSRIEY